MQLRRRDHRATATLEEGPLWMPDQHQYLYIGNAARSEQFSHIPQLEWNEDSLPKQERKMFQELRRSRNSDL
jgi:hypothetical protein